MKKNPDFFAYDSACLLCTAHNIVWRGTGASNCYLTLEINFGKDPYFESVNEHIFSTCELLSLYKSRCVMCVYPN